MSDNMHGAQLKADGVEGGQGISAEATKHRLKHGTSRACQERLMFTYVGRAIYNHWFPHIPADCSF
jgi:hypothetical protein